MRVQGLSISAPSPGWGYSQACMWVLGNLNPGPHGCSAITLSTGPSPQPSSVFLNVGLRFPAAVIDSVGLFHGSDTGTVEQDF